MGTIDTKEKFEAKRLELAEHEWARMKGSDSRECRNCHSFDGMDTEKQKLRGSKMHKIAQDEKKTCIDCHKGIAHHKPKGMKEDDDD
jgi:cytochrome c-type protein NapC